MAAASGCVSQRDSMVRQGYPPAYADGFQDGCTSGKKAAGSMFDQFSKDVRRFSREPQYAQGWNDGYRECQKEWEAMERQNRDALRQQQLMEQRRHDRKMEKREFEKGLLQGIDTRGLERLEEK